MTDSVNSNVERLELAHRRRLAAGRAEREAQRKDLLGSLIEADRRAADLRDWIERFAPRVDASRDARLLRLLEWAGSELAALEAMCDPQRLSDEMKARNLFPQVDPLTDPLGEPPRAHAWGW